MEETQNTTLSSNLVARYIESVSLEVQPDPALVDSYLQELQQSVADFSSQTPTPACLERVLSYLVPKMTDDGCSMIDGTLADDPYQLSKTLGLQGGIEELVESDIGKRLFILDSLVAKVTKDTGVDWLGFYQSRTVNGEQPALVKIVYRGSESRAEFPLTKEFAKESNNSFVGLSGKAVVINDIEQYLWSKGGPYYQCDSKVHSEACLPVFSLSGDSVVGILDAEAWEREKYTTNEISKLCAIAILLSQYLQLP